MRAAGQDPSDRGTAAVMAAACEQFMLLRETIAATRTLSGAAMDAGVTALGSGFGSALTFGERFGHDRHAGVAAFRPVGYDSKCSCFDYSRSVVTFA